MFLLTIHMHIHISIKLHIFKAYKNEPMFKFNIMPKGKVGDARKKKTNLVHAKMQKLKHALLFGRESLKSYKR